MPMVHVWIESIDDHHPLGYAPSAIYLRMVIQQPLSPPMLISDYNRTVSSPPFLASHQSTRKRKRQCDDNDLSLPDLSDHEHMTKKQRDEILAPLTPTSPPLSFSTLQRSPPMLPQGNVQYNCPLNKDTSAQLPPPSSIAYPLQQESTKSILSNDETSIPSKNLFLRDLHMNSRVYAYNQTRDESDVDEDNEMWEGEEETVTMRYSGINKILGSRRVIW